LRENKHSKKGSNTPPPPGFVFDSPPAPGNNIGMLIPLTLIS